MSEEGDDEEDHAKDAEGDGWDVTWPWVSMEAAEAGLGRCSPIDDDTGIICAVWVGNMRVTIAKVNALAKLLFLRWSHGCFSSRGESVCQ